ncbi:tRNA (guanosine(37)-N1)-methyltransferase TrmD [Pseudomarimonas arenosa]|uniref:tRNA (guanine-N(1)-)-methyltransferase n=1 Tax=Pseudomarimonas arenosa TaxID=2774145 RepID=A0AAW3ZKZ7_9GAMM|nr:tRNA (guanosine(37)-N1)-methyltransferase TrmD [Pseudomarimonas arenosa]MBD8526189.1 tRNA (guanosine(37)-N1)-methyltransferase TrmD [Pseudomarimonas arenosa]
MTAAPRIDVITLFPEFIESSLEVGVVGRAVKRGLLSVQSWQLRDFAHDNYKTIDHRPYGGGPGMVMLIDPLRECLQMVRQADPRPAHVVYLSPQGQPLTQAKVRELAHRPRLVLLCGRYEGIDERLLQAEVDEEVSIGDYVLSGGELAAAVLVDAVGRLQDGALNDPQSAVQDSFENGVLDCPHYTRPERHELGDVPALLASGDHRKIARWRRQQSLGRTWLRRPDVLARCDLSADDRQLLAEFIAEWRAQDGGPGAVR